VYDIAGKALGVPVYQLLGGKQRDIVPCFATTGGDTVEQMIEKVQMLIELGWQCIRVGPAGGARLRMLHRSSSRVSRLASQRSGSPSCVRRLAQRRCWDRLPSSAERGETASFCQRMPSGTLDFLEEPIRDETPEAYESLRTMVDVPFAIGEEFASKWQFLPYIERGSPTSHA